jgi:hypothetical protein
MVCFGGGLFFNRAASKIHFESKPRGANRRVRKAAIIHISKLEAEKNAA